MTHIAQLDYRDDWLPAEDIASALAGPGYIVLPNIIPEPVLAELALAVQSHDSAWKRAAIGRGSDEHTNRFVRRDKIAWLDPNDSQLQRWFAAARELRLALNRRLFLGLWDFECHLAHYESGDFYKRHLDAFRGRSNRRVSLVAYLNSGWTPDHGGELVIYPPDDQQPAEPDLGSGAETTLPRMAPLPSMSGVVDGAHDGVVAACKVPLSNLPLKVTPLMGTVVLFLSEEIPHEVLPVTRDRYSVAGWFRVNDTLDNRVDPAN